MKTLNKPQIRKVRNKLNHDEVYFTYFGETKDIDGVTFIPVFKNVGIRDTVRWMKKDSMELVK
jgi:hypothetical protein